MNRREHDSALSPHEGAAQLTVRLKSLAQNYREAKARAQPAAVAPVVKADAYSLGMAEVSLALSKAGADTFFVSRLEEGIALRVLLRNARIFVLDGVAKGTAPALAAHGLIPVLNSLDEIAEWSALGGARKTKLDAALHIDTGMNRSGLSREDVDRLASQPCESLAGILLVLAMSHLACADEPEHRLNRTQLERFRAALAKLPQAHASLTASAGIELGRDYHFDMVRPGLGLYGGNPILSRSNPYRTVVGLTSRVLQVRRLERGETVGYGASFMASRACVLATVAAGYGDGLMRAGSAKGRAILGGVSVPFAGRISMDLVALDATEVPVAACVRGAEVEFLGDAIALDQVAAAAGTISHEVLTSITPRARRVYVEE
jgi:alanine racemase